MWRRGALVLVTALAPAAARATIIVNLDLDGVVAHADSVVIGTVVGERSLQADGHVVTETDIAVAETLVGVSVTSLVVTQPGGRDGSRTVTVQGTVALQRGQRVLLMTETTRLGRHVIVGLCQGAFVIDGERVVQRVPVAVIDADGRVSAPPGERVFTLERVRAAIARRGR